ncbi:MAG: carboxypeptidase-like regulatory domain-containing protein [Planctomycetota bacterium]|nr:carboxypeptidase-like regulatory domain-containing protein [Planctomycetota bacterium]
MSAFRGFLLCLTATSLVGCSGGTEDRQPTHYVTGVVKMAGGPITGATVMFTPTTGQRVATGVTDDNGKYELTTYETGDGAMPGVYKVLVIRTTKAKETIGGELDHKAFGSGKDDPTDSAHDAQNAASKELTSSLPEKYATAESTDLTTTVEANSENVINLTLEP